MEDIISLMVLGAIVAVVSYTGLQLYELFLNLTVNQIDDVLHKVAVVVVLVKAYRLLVFYMKNHHVSIRYIIEISIIAPAVELIFAPVNRPLSLNILYGVFSATNLFIYLLYYKRIFSIEDTECKKHSEGFE